MRLAAMGLLGTILLLSTFPGLVTADPSDEQFRNEIDLPPSSRFPLGTDDLGRNRMARLLHGTRTSLLLAPAAAALSVLLACAIGLTAGSGGRLRGLRGHRRGPQGPGDDLRDLRRPRGAQRRGFGLIP